MKKIMASAFALALLLTGCSAKPAEMPKPENTEKPTIRSEISEMSLEDKVGQLFMVCCDRNNMDPVLEKQPGGILMFSVDFDVLSRDEVKTKIDGYKKALKIEPYIAVDEEGGTVVRVSNHKALAQEQYKSPQYYYNIGGIPAIVDNAEEKSKLLASLGINMNLAPVADVSTDPADFIYDRSLGQDAKTTAQYVSAVVSTMKKHNVASCLKHFPGYGSNADTHTGSSTDNRTLDEFRKKDFLPFEAGIDAGAEAVMVSHNIVTNIDAVPASVSPEMHRMLRVELAFDGIIITDDMSMAAVDGYSEPYVSAVLAGNDMIIVSDLDKAYNEVLSAVKNGTIPMEVLDAAVGRILKQKQK